MTKKIPGAVRGRPKGTAVYTERIVVPVDPPLLEALDRASAESGVGRAEFVRAACELAIKMQERRKRR